MQETQVWSLGWEDRWRRKWQPTSVFLPVKCQGHRSLVGYNPWGHKRVGHNLATKQRLCNFSCIHFTHNVSSTISSFSKGEGGLRFLWNRKYGIFLDFRSPPALVSFSYPAQTKFNFIPLLSILPFQSKISFIEQISFLTYGLSVYY